MAGHGSAGCGGVWALPPILGPDRVAVRRQQRCEAVATWTESLRDLVSAGAGLHHAITVSARKAPEPIATEISELAGAIHRGDRLPAALRRCGHHLDDRTADLVIATLATATAGHAGAGVARQLAALAATARDQVATRRRLEPQRARVRTSVRIITATSVGTVAFLAVTSHQFLAPYGQLDRATDPAGRRRPVLRRVPAPWPHGTRARLGPIPHRTGPARPPSPTAGPDMTAGAIAMEALSGVVSLVEALPVRAILLGGVGGLGLWLVITGLTPIHSTLSASLAELQQPPARTPPARGNSFHGC
ncbi:type II secretion system F family protein [Fodinicola feengrottensis]|uniref:type II secretion system F family protein n=1 Tax=Fodinicola feengrottensis TaxID=435914 RepID=UPI0013D51293|nr:type II secretion system F family protein [Fodinicola feengrottensis]